MTRHNFFLPNDLVAKLKAVAAESGMPMSELVRRALLAYFNERDARKAAG